MQDNAFLEAAAKTGLDIEPVSGVELQRIVDEIVKAPKEVTDRLAAIIALPDQKKN